MKYIILVLWTFSLFLLMFSSFPFRVECRPTRAMGPGPPPLIFPTTRTFRQISCPVLEGPSVIMINPWPDLYRPDITVKVWDTPIVLEGTARSRSDVRADGTFGVTFDLHRVVKGDAPLLRRRTQFRLQFLDNPSQNNSLGSSTSNNFNPNRNNNVIVKANNNANVNSHSNSNSLNRQMNSRTTTTSHNNNQVALSTHAQRHSRRGRSNSASAPSSLMNNMNNPRHARNNNNSSIMTVQSASSTLLHRNNLNLNNNNILDLPDKDVLSATIGGAYNSKCVPPKATVKTGRKYFVFAAKVENHFVAVFSPELANKKNTKAVEGILCKGCGQAPSVVAPKEVILQPKERLRVRCRLKDGNPVPVLTWYKDGRPVNLSDSRYRLRPKRRQSILVIRKAKESDVGLYKCQAKNIFGSAHATTKVTLSPKAAVPKPIKPVGTTPTTLWPLQGQTCPFDSYCLNGGTCSYYQTIGEYVCQCAEGYKGQRCDTKDIPTSGSMYLSYFCIYGSNNPHYPC